MLTGFCVVNRIAPRDIEKMCRVSQIARAARYMLAAPAFFLTRLANTTKDKRLQETPKTANKYQVQWHKVKIHSTARGELMPEGIKVVRRLPPVSVEVSIGTSEVFSVVAFMV